MAEHEVAQVAVEAKGWLAPVVSSFATLATALGGKHIWDRTRKPRPTAAVTHADFLEIKATLVKLSEGQDKRGLEMAVLTERMATKEDLNDAVEKLGDKARMMVDAVHNRLSSHIDGHAKGEFR